MDQVYNPDATDRVPVLGCDSNLIQFFLICCEVDRNRSSEGRNYRIPFLVERNTGNIIDFDDGTIVLIYMDQILPKS